MSHLSSQNSYTPGKLVLFNLYVLGWGWGVLLTDQFPLLTLYLGKPEAQAVPGPDGAVGHMVLCSWFEKSNPPLIFLLFAPLFTPALLLFYKSL